MTDEWKKLNEQLKEEIVERKRMEEALLEREAQYRALFEGSPDAVLLADPETGIIVDANPAASRLLARPHEEIVGLHQSNIHPPQREAYSRESFTQHVEEMRGRADLHPIENTVIRPDGSEVPVEILAKLVIIKRKKILQGVFRDITERKRVEETLRESRNLLQTVLDTIPARVFWKDRDLRYLGCNQPFALDAGVNAPEEMIGKDDYQMAWREQADLYRSDDRHVMESGKPKIHYEEPQTTPDGRRLWLRTNKVPLQHADGTVWGVLGTYEDITEYKRADAERERLIGELELRNAELERFTYTVSHDLKSPLITMRGFLAYLEKDALTGNTERIRADIGRIMDATNKMDRLLRELLELSRIGRVMNPPKQLSFEEIAREAVGLVEGRLQERGIRVEIAAGMPVVSGDRVRLVEVVQNLVDNAAKFMGNQSAPLIEVGVRREERNGKPVFFVRDNGIGIEPRYQEKIFGLFDKLDPKTEGTGIGLALVKRIIEVHGGTIWIESDGSGNGATFCFTLPPAQTTTTHGG